MSSFILSFSVDIFKRGGECHLEYYASHVLIHLVNKIGSEPLKLEQETSKQTFWIRHRINCVQYLKTIYIINKCLLLQYDNQSANSRTLFEKDSPRENNKI